MSIEELISVCENAINNQLQSAGGCVTLTVPCPKSGFRYQRNVLPFGRSGPKCQVVGSTNDGRLIVWAKAEKILNWIEKRRDLTK